jgi:hypothetical protein
VSGFLGTLKIAESWMSTSGVFERRSWMISLSHGGCSRAEVRGILSLTLSILDLRKRKFLRNPKIFVVQDDLWCWHIPGPEFFACRVRRDAEYSIEDDHGSRGSFDEDLCKAFAIAAIGPKPVLKVVSFPDSASATAALRAGTVDVVADFSHAVTPGLRLSRQVLNDGIGFSRSSGGENRSRSRPCRKEGLLPHGNKCGSRFAQLV